MGIAPFLLQTVKTGIAAVLSLLKQRDVKAATLTFGVVVVLPGAKHTAVLQDITAVSVHLRKFVGRVDIKQKQAVRHKKIMHLCKADGYILL